MDYFEAEKLVNQKGGYASPDFYRMQYSLTIALGLRDKPVQILHDVVHHGSEEAKAAFNSALECGYIQQHVDPETEITYFDVVDIEGSEAPYYFRSHLAMQCAYPGLYFEYFGGTHIWEFSNPKMQNLIELCVSCLTNKSHPSDYYGQHEIIEEKVARGRPKTKERNEKNTGFKEWVKACQEYKHQLSQAWEVYLEKCEMRKQMRKQAKTWLNDELNRLRQEMADASQQVKDGMAYYDKEVDFARNVHTELKAKGKPKRTDFN